MLRIETFEKLAFALDTTIEDIFSASKDGIERICVVNNFCSVMNIEIDGKPYAVVQDEGKWIEISSKELSVKITGEFFAEVAMKETDICGIFTGSVYLDVESLSSTDFHLLFGYDDQHNAFGSAERVQAMMYLQDYSSTDYFKALEQFYSY